MSSLAPAPVGPTLPRLTIEGYEDLMRAGHIREGAPFELIGGLIVPKNRAHRGEDIMTQGHEHLRATRALTRMVAVVEAAGGVLQIQGPLRLPPSGLPEPDGLILIGPEPRYEGRIPDPDDVACVIELSDSSLSLDRGVKLMAYAQAGIPEYLLINLVDRVAELYSDPDVEAGSYRHARILGREGQARLEARLSLTLPVNPLIGY